MVLPDIYSTVQACDATVDAMKYSGPAKNILFGLKRDTIIGKVFYVEFGICFTID